MYNALTPGFLGVAAACTMPDSIKIKGAREHNLKSVDLAFPKNKLVVFTGVSGSGKSSLAFDTIYAEGRRRYVESLSSYARQFLGVMSKPDVDLIEGLSPAISIDQKTTSHNPRSTVGTVTEIYDYLRLLFARVGHPHCPICGREIAGQSLDQIVASALEMLTAHSKSNKVTRALLLAPLVKDKKGEFTGLFENLKAKGFKKVRIDGQVRSLEDELLLLKNNKHTIEVVMDRLSFAATDLKDKIFDRNFKARLTDSIEQALKISEGLVLLAFVKDPGYELVEYPKKFEDHLLSEKFACPVDNISLPEIEPRSFSFNSPHGACPTCSGIGKILKVVPELVFAQELSMTEGGILPFANAFESDTWYSKILLAFAQGANIDPKVPLKKLTAAQRGLILKGTGQRQYKVEGTNRQGNAVSWWTRFEGVANMIERRRLETVSDSARNNYERFMREFDCDTCKGARLKDESLAVTLATKNISEVTTLPIDQALEWVGELEDKVLSPKEVQIGRLILKEIITRLKFLVAVGLDYLTLGRAAGTLAGGEAQRIRLASQIGTGLTGVLYVLDEPTIGLHARDNARLIATLKQLRDLGNTVVVVEHDHEMMKEADHLVDFGPGAGKHGGAVVAQGSLTQVKKSSASLTGKYLSGKKKIKVTVPRQLEVEEKKSLLLKGANAFNLKKIDLEIPLGKFVCITGVSGSGKSTLIVETLYHAIRKEQNYIYRQLGGKYDSLEGVDNVDKVVLIDQSPIGRTPRSNPATYTKVFDDIRAVFTASREAKAAGYKKGRFSFNVKGGRCEACEGQGQNKIEMQFMADIWVKCEVCQGKRYNEQTLEVTYRGKNISEVLGMTIGEAAEFFHLHPSIVRRLETLKAVGLDYMELGQSAPTLSGGEAQRVKLSSELSKRATGNTVYILDEPTTGLHFADLEKLLNVLKLLVAKGNSVVVIEHNMDVIKNADWIVDLGPEGGEKGGEIVAQGTVKTLMKAKNSYTGGFLKKAT